MKKKILEVKQALSNRLYNSALALTLTLPSICARAEFDAFIDRDRKI